MAMSPMVSVPLLPGPVLPGPVLPGPVLPGPILPGPILPGFRGVDPDALGRLAHLLEEAGWALLDHRRELQPLLTRIGVSPAVARRLLEVEDWLAAATADLRRRQQAAEQHGSGPGSAPARATAPPPPSTRGAHLVRTVVGSARFGTDALSGVGLSGYAVVGLAYRHLGAETRVVTRTWDYGGGWQVTVAETERRGVFEVSPGLGWETVTIVRLGQRKWYDPWSGVGQRTTYRHNGVEVGPGDFAARPVAVTPPAR